MLQYSSGTGVDYYRAVHHFLFLMLGHYRLFHRYLLLRMYLFRERFRSLSTITLHEVILSTSALNRFGALALSSKLRHAALEVYHRFAM